MRSDEEKLRHPDHPLVVVTLSHDGAHVEFPQPALRATAVTLLRGLENLAGLAAASVENDPDGAQVDAAGGRIPELFLAPAPEGHEGGVVHTTRQSARPQ